MKRPDTIRAIPVTLGALAAVCLAIVACSGPQPLGQAIVSEAETAYGEALRAHGQDPASAYLSMRAPELGISQDEAAARDLALSTTKNPFNARKDPIAVSRGAVVYKRHCADCHGVNADGRGKLLPEAVALADFHDFSHRFAVTLHGGVPRS